MKKRAKVIPSAKKEQPETDQVVLTLSVSSGEVVKVERLDKSGHRHPVSEEEFAEWAGEDDAEDLATLLEEAYAAGISAAVHDEIGEDEESEEDEEFVRRFMLRRAAGRKLLRKGVRKFIMRRGLERETVHRRTRPEANGHSNGAKG